MASTYKVARDIYLIDTQMYHISEFTSAYLLTEEKMTLIETGTANSAKFTLDGICQLGYNPRDIAYVIVTHIHLDHAGAAGILLQDMPQAKLLVHPKGTKHLIDPSRLIKTVEQAEGEEELKRSGLPLPVPQERVYPVKDGEIIELGEEQKLKIIYSPGHAKHHICIYTSKNKGLFTGDSVGIYFPDKEILIPTTPPPDFDLETCLNSIKQLMDMPTDILLFPHFGISRNAKQILELAIRELEVWGEIVLGAMKEGGFENAAERLKRQAAKELESIRGRKAIYEYLIEDFVPVCAAGYMNWYQKKLEGRS